MTDDIKMLPEDESPPKGWTYAFNCRDCAQVQPINDDATGRHGDYCTAILRGEVTIHADDDRVLRCDSWVPRARTIWEEMLKGAPTIIEAEEGET